MQKFEIQFLPQEIQIGNRKAPYSDSYELLKEMAALGSFSYDGKPLIVDLFSRAKPHFEVRKDETGTLYLEGFFEVRAEKIPFSALQKLIPFHPPFFIYKSMLKMVNEEISAKFLQNIPRKISSHELKELQEETDVILHFTGDALKDPLPVLKLTDRGGAFANLLMDYGDSLDVFERNTSCEALWEKDLIETGYQKKQVDNSSYYCPLDKVGKCLAFLLEIGWKVLDYRGNELLLETKRKFEATTKNGKIALHGEVCFASFKADLSKLKGAFNRKERFLELGEGKAGLIADCSAIEELLQQAEWKDDQPTLNSFHLPLVLECGETVLAPDLEKIKNALSIPQHALAPSKDFQGVLRPYQARGLEWLERLQQAGLNGVLADEMGLGKTVQVIAYLSLRDQHARHLIVVPSSLLFNWEEELSRFLPSLSCERFKGILPEKGVLLISYHALRSNISHFQGHQWDTIILDEAHTIKNPDSQIARAVRALKSHFRISMTGTLVENHSRELWSHFEFLMPGLLGDREEFEGNLSLGEVDSRYLARTQKLVRPFILRRRKEEVAPELPSLTEQTVHVEMSEEQRGCYDNFLITARKSLKSGAKKIEIFETLLRLRQICCHPHLIGFNAPSAKMEALIDDLLTIAEEGKKALVFSQFASMLQLIAKELKEKGIPFVLLDGSTIDREAPVKQFQQDPKVPVFLISLKAGGVGLNLTAADYVLLFDPWWNEAAEKQAIGRAHRIGQKKPVLVKRYIAKESIEEKLLSLKNAKEKLASQILDEALIGDALSLEELLNLLDCGR